MSWFRGVVRLLINTRILFFVNIYRKICKLQKFSGIYRRITEYFQGFRDVQRFGVFRGLQCGSGIVRGVRLLSGWLLS